MKARARKAVQQLRKWTAKRLRKRSKAARARWQASFRHPSVLVWSLCVSALLMTILPVWAFQEGFWFGVSFLVAVTFSVVEGHMLTHPARVLLIAIGVSLGSALIPELRNEGWEALAQGNIVAAFLVGGIGVYLWKVRQNLETAAFVPDRKTRPRKRKGQVKRPRREEASDSTSAVSAPKARRPR